ncbi:hypothetical protein BD847_2749 [Flavobacterium cutihirudinis]|uniref:Uncharacterized protein n=1 Tax=Flavobacterium cutihirudinis TaxID=1265740 RepID=A0A3D9FT07_9FLAO|nr:hypothetical protein BD847_2749 [Flavobacterium cutihirudinis]
MNAFLFIYFFDVFLEKEARGKILKNFRILEVLNLIK